MASASESSKAPILLAVLWSSMKSCSWLLFSELRDYLAAQARPNNDVLLDICVASRMEFGDDSRHPHVDRILAILEGNKAKRAEEERRRAEEEERARQQEKCIVTASSSKYPSELASSPVDKDGDVVLSGYLEDNGEEDDDVVHYTWSDTEEVPDVPVAMTVCDRADGYVSGDEEDDEEEQSQTTSSLSGSANIDCGYGATVDISPLDAYKGNGGALACDWSGRFESLTHLMKTMDANTPFQRRVETNEGLMRLANDFLLSAELYGRTIISEIFLPHSQKTIKPATDSFGGVAGGEKYVVRDIYFKFGLDIKGLYDGDANAAKAAGHELKGIMAYHNCFLKNIHLPLTAVIDYRGFRLTAMSRLPVTNRSLIYGSADAGQTVHNDMPEFEDLMERAARKLNLAEHTVAGQRIYSAFDVEGHHVSGRFYLLDLARTFPPELALKEDRPTWPKNAFLYRLLRPELVKKSPVPLSSDASARQQMSDPRCKDLNRDVRTMKHILRTKVIPGYASKFVEQVQKVLQNSERERESALAMHSLAKFKSLSASGIVRRATDASEKGEVFLEKFPLKQYLHAEGINMRHMGFLAEAVRNDIPEGTQGRTEALVLLYTEMCVRTVRSVINAAYRDHMKQLAVPLEEPYRLLLAHYLNKLLGNSAAAEEFWAYLREKVVEKFTPAALGPKAAAPDFCLRNLLAHEYPGGRTSGFRLLYVRLKKLMGFKFETITEQEARTREAFYRQTTPFDDIDMRDIGLRVKHMGVVNHARGYIFKMRASKLTDDGKKLIMLHKALKNFEDVLESDPTNFVTLRNCGQVRQQMEDLSLKKQSGKPPKHLPLSRPGVIMAGEFYKRAVEASPKDTHSLYQYAQFLVRCDQVPENELLHSLLLCMNIMARVHIRA